MHRPSLQLHTWLISFSLLNSFPVTFMSFAPFGRENFIHDNCFKPRQQFEDREQYVYFHFSIWLSSTLCFFSSLAISFFVTISSSPAFTDLFVHYLFLWIFLLYVFIWTLLFLSFLSREQYLYFEFVLLLPSFLPSLYMLFILSFVCLLNCLFF